MGHVVVGTVSCVMCPAAATIKMQFSGTGLGHFCFEHADQMMRELAFENIKGGSTREQTKEGYMRWRRHVGRPVQGEEVDGWLNIPPL